MAEQKIYPKGLRTFDKNANAPEFVLGTLIITPNELVAWLKENANYLTDYNGTKQLKLQILKGEKGVYFTVDTFVPKAKNETPQRKQQPSNVDVIDESSDLPF